MVSNRKARPCGLLGYGMRFLFLGALVVGPVSWACPWNRVVAEEPSNQATQNPPDKEEATNKREDEPPPVKEEAPDLAADLKDKVNDREPIPPWVENNPEPEAKAYCLTLIQAKQTSAQAFANSTQKDVAFVHLFEEPEKYRGKVVHFEGNLLRVVKQDPPKYVKGDTYGINVMYEGWVFAVKKYGANPVCIVFTDLPPGISVGDELDKIPVTFDAYFFKRYRYKAGDGWRDAPLFIGRTLQVKHDPMAGASQAMSSFTKNLVMGFLAMLVATAGLAVLLNWWYRHGDRRIHRLMADANPPTFAEPDANALAREEAENPDNGRFDDDGLDESPASRNGLKHDTF